MSFQKLSYGGTKINNYIYFSFEGEYFDPNKITIELNIEPTSTKSKRKPVPKKTSWKFQIDVGNEIDLETPTQKIIKTLEPKIEEIIKLKKKYNLKTRLQFVINIDIDPKASTPFFPLNKRTINFLSKTETQVDFDIYKANTIGLMKNKYT